MPTDADSPKFKTTVGSVKWVPENSEIVWSIKSFPVRKRHASIMIINLGAKRVEVVLAEAYECVLSVSGREGVPDEGSFRAAQR